MAINLERVLTISATEWFAISGKSPTEYRVMGIHSNVGNMDFAMKQFAEAVPSCAEVVVGYKITSASAGHYSNLRDSSYACGTALIPKKE